MRFVCADGDPESHVLVEEALRGGPHELAWFDGTPRDADEWCERVRGAEGVLLMWSLPSGVLTASPSVRAVSFAGTGVQAYVDLEEANRAGVTVCNVPRY